jgi:hypothetical protein
MYTAAKHRISKAYIELCHEDTYRILRMGKQLYSAAANFRNDKLLYSGWRKLCI